MKSTGKNKIVKALELLLILMLVFTAIPAMPGEAASTKSKAMSAYKKKLSSSKLTVLPAGRKVMNRNDRYVTYRYSKRANVKFAIAYINNDNVPELILKDNYYGYGVWAYQNGRVKCVLWGDTYDDPYGYYRKKGIYEDIGWSEGSPFTKSFYQFKNGKMTEKLSKFVYQEGQAEADYYMHSSSYRYPREISKATFKKKLKSYVGSTHVTKISLKSNTSANRKKYLK